MSEKPKQGEVSTFRLTYHESEFPAGLSCGAHEPIQNLTKEQMRTVINHLPPDEARKSIVEGVRMLNHVLDEGGPKAVIAFVAVGRHYLKEGKILQFDFARMKREQETLRRNLRAHDSEQFQPGEVEEYQIPSPEKLQQGLRGRPMNRLGFCKTIIGLGCATAWGVPGLIDTIDRAATGGKQEPKDERNGPQWLKTIRPVSTYFHGLPGELAEIGISAYFIIDAMNHFGKEWKEQQFEEISNAVAIAADVLGIQPELHYTVDQRPYEERRR